MKILMILFFTILPAAAQACGGGPGPGGGPGGCGFAPFLLGAVIAALGYWVLQHSGKDNPVYVKLTGAVVGFALVVIGLLGLLCTLGSHVRKSVSCRGTCPEHGMMGQGMMMEGGQGGGGNGGGQGGGQGEASSMPEAKTTPSKK